MDIALLIRRELEKAGHIVWQDLTAIKGGDEWIKSIESGVERSYALVTVVSESSKKSEWVQIEYLHAKRRGKTIIPIKVDASEIPTLMLAMNVVHGHPDLNAGIAQLLASLPAPTEIKPESQNRRALELRYLDSLLLDHSVWQQVYTPMAGVGQLQAPMEHKKQGVQMRTTPTTIDVGYLGQKFQNHSEDEQRGEAISKQYEADITPALEEMRQLVILGEPGAGKTTTLWKSLSDHALQAKADPNASLPVLVRLGALGSMGLEYSLKAALEPLESYYDDLLKEKRLVFLLDGLNEMPTTHRDENLKAIKTLSEQCRRENMLLAVTCRELDYTSVLNLNLTGRVTIQPLDPPRIQRFVNGYIEELDKSEELFWQLAGGVDVEKAWKKWEQAGASFEAFWTAEKIPDGIDLWPYESTWQTKIRDRKRSMMALAANPYMLYMITQVFTQAGVLPPDRGLLFQWFIDYLLEKRERLAPEQADQLKSRLADLAYAMQAEGEGTAFTSEQVMAHLKDEQVLYHARSASLLAGGDQIRFTHQLLQEYFAAHRLQALMANTKAEALFPKESWWEPQGWEETLILLAGLYSDDCTPVIDWLKNAQPEVAARCIVESGAYCPVEILTELREHWTPRLTDLKNDPAPAARAAVGRALGRLQVDGVPLDNRKGVSIIEVDGMVLPDIDWVEIPAGKFTYQEKEERFEPTYYIARFPITFAQFQTFLDDPLGFANPHWWDGLSVDDEHKRAPGEQAFQFYNHPRDRVSWYDAIVFCRWLTEKVKTHPQLLPEKLAGMKDCVIGLPTEWQWEKAARGMDGEEYPYYRHFFGLKGNVPESLSGHSSSVGIFPNVTSPFGVMEIIGNVLEWCLNKYMDPLLPRLYEDCKVVKGNPWGDEYEYSWKPLHNPMQQIDRNMITGFRIIAHNQEG
jgi:formylglycine-generating enzyme required for sulfatase activity